MVVKPHVFLGLVPHMRVPTRISSRAAGAASTTASCKMTLELTAVDLLCVPLSAAQGKSAHPQSLADEGEATYTELSLDT